MVQRKWSCRHRARGGRPRTAQDIERLIVRLARENTDWGNGKIQDELVKLGYSIDEETVANILKRYGIAPAPLRRRSASWRQLMAHYQAQILACDFFTVETVFLKILYVMVFIELGSRRVHFAGCTAHPKQHWVTQQARQLVWELEGLSAHDLRRTFIAEALATGTPLATVQAAAGHARRNDAPLRAGSRGTEGAQAAVWLMICPR